MNRGEWGEKLALEYYQKNGYILLQANYRTRGGEIDLIVQKQNRYVFAEVKTRSVATPVRPAAFVDIKKQKKIQNTALIYLQEKELGDVSMRFDVVEIWVNSKGESRLHCIENAF